MTEFFSVAFARLPELQLRIAEHLTLVGISVGFSILIGVPLGVVAYRYRQYRGPILAFAGVLQTIPSLALLAFLLTMFGRIGVLPALVALTLYGLLPIARNTLTALDEVDGGLLRAATALGMTEAQRYLKVIFPLAVPTILAGIRTSSVIGVGVATLAAFIGAGGLGDFIYRGLTLSNTNLILLGAIPSALLALAIDGAWSSLAWGFHRRGQGPLIHRPLARIGVGAVPFLLLTIGAQAIMLGQASTSSEGLTVTVGSKSFTEQVILGEVLAQSLEREGINVVRKLNLGGSLICHEALVNREIDMYVEYTGTALQNVLGVEFQTSQEDGFALVRERYRKEFDLEWLNPLGFNNAWAILMAQERAQDLGISTISGLIPHADQMTFASVHEFSERPDGYPGLKKAYGITFKEIREMDNSILHQTIADGVAEVGSGAATDGRISAFDLTILEDDRGFFPHYYAAVVTTTTLAKNSVVSKALTRLEGKISAARMQQSNFEVDENKRSPKEVAADLLKSILPGEF